MNELTGKRGLKLWGLCHQLRLTDAPDTRNARSERGIEHLLRGRDEEIEAFEKRDQYGELLEYSKARIERIQARYKKLIAAPNRFGFESGPQIPQPYAGIGSDHKLVSDPPAAAFVFMTVECYLAIRPMQHALAWRVYVEKRGIHGFRSFPVCANARGAYLVHRRLVRNIDRMVWGIWTDHIDEKRAKESHELQRSIALLRDRDQLKTLAS